MKKCSKCKVPKSGDQFSKRSDAPDGLSYVCKACKAAAKRKRYQENPAVRQADIDRVQFAYRNDEGARRRHIDGVKKYQAKKTVRERIRCRARERYATEPFFRLRLRMAVNVGKSLKEQKCGRHWETLVGYTVEELRAHLEPLLEPGMTWENYGDWHIDHIIPLSALRPTSTDDPAFAQAWSLGNLQPLWAMDNYRKGARVI